MSAEVEDNSRGVIHWGYLKQELEDMRRNRAKKWRLYYKMITWSRIDLISDETGKTQLVTITWKRFAKTINV